MLERQEFRSVDELSDRIEAWDELVEQRPMRSPTWLLGWWEEFGGDGKELCILLFYADGQLVGLAPLYADATAGRCVYKLLGSTGDVCTDHTTWFAKDGFQSQVGQSVAQFFAESNSWTRIHLASVDKDDAAIESMLKRLESQGGYLAHRKSTVSCWTLPIPTAWDEYLGVLSKSHRKRCRRLIRGYFDTDRVTIHEATTDNFAEVWQLFLNMHASRWGSDQRPEGSFSDRRFRRFHERVARRHLERGQLRLCYLMCDGLPIAAEYQFFDAHTLYAYQSGMAPDHGDLQPGNLSLIATIQFCIRRGLTKMDLLRGDEPYKAHWRAGALPCQDIRIWPNGIGGRMEMTALGAKQLAASWLKAK